MPLSAKVKVILIFMALVVFICATAQTCGESIGQATCDTVSGQVCPTK
jgi:hypothetical protein